jgi:cell division protein FtsI (penicillin-binding protein 3)
VADEIGQARMEDLFRKLGFHEPPHIELRERGRTLWPRDWGRVTTMTVAYGHGIAVSPLHLASAYAAMVNGGIWRPATLRKVAPGKAAHGRRVYSAQTSATMRKLMRLIVTDGTGKKANVEGFRVGGKTGTAEKPGVGGYSKHVNVSTFAAAFPMDAPRYVVLAMLDAPKGSAESFGLTTAAWTAAPVVAKVIARTGPMLGVYPDADREVAMADMQALLWKAKGE